MRDPGLVQRAEQAALALERAWEYWRIQRGVGAENATPVSSYVGYSLEEPWGQPRVVFGLGAEEAEMLAAVIIGHDYIGPVHADLTDWPRAAGNQSALPTAPQMASEDRVPVPVQARSLAESDPSADESAEPDQVVEPAGHQPIVQERAEREPAGHQPIVQERVEREPAEEQADRQTQPAEPVNPAIAAIGPGGERDPLPAEVLPVAELVPLPAAETDGGPYIASSRRTAHRGQRFQGIPPQYRSEGQLPDSEGAGSDDGAAGLASDQPDRPAPLAVSKLSRPRRSQRGEREVKTRQQERQPTAADTVV
jgi:hypothetical protein